jgi:DNA-binding LacI/PurR family transcriptional regulator
MASCSSTPRSDDTRAAVLVQAGVPFVAFGRTGGRIPHDVVDVDNAAGGRVIAQELAANGCEWPAFVGWPEGSLAGDERLMGFLDGWREAGHDPELVAVLRRLNRVDDGLDAAMSLLRADQPADAVVAASDLLAVGVLRAARALGIRAGQDLRVVGFDDAPIAAHLDPPLTTVGQPIREVAKRIVATFLERLDHPDAPVHDEALEPHLVVRLT